MHNFHEANGAHVPKINAYKSGVESYSPFPLNHHNKKYSAIHSKADKAIHGQNKYQAYSLKYNAGVSQYRHMPDDGKGSSLVGKVQNNKEFASKTIVNENVSTQWQIVEKPSIGIKRMAKVILKMMDYLKTKWDKLKKKLVDE